MVMPCDQENQGSDQESVLCRRISQVQDKLLI